MTERYVAEVPELSIEQRRSMFADSLRVIEGNMQNGMLSDVEGEQLVKHQIARFAGMTMSELALLGLNTRQLMRAVLEAGPVQSNVSLEAE